MATIELEKIGSDFIKENAKVPKQDIRKGGPYSKAQRSHRRNEVYHLHFEYEYPATKIADMMNINRHTISDDISYWYGKLATEWNKVDVYGWHMKQLYSLESQKQRLLEELKKAKTLSNKITIEKLLLQIDDRITKLITQANKTEEKTRHDAISMLNKFAQNNGLEHRFVDQYSLLKVPEERLRKIQKVLRDES